MRSVAFKGTLLLNAIPLFKELSMSMIYRTSTNAHKTTHTQMHTILVVETTQNFLTETTTPCHQMLLNPLVLQHREPYNLRTSLTFTT